MERSDYPALLASLAPSQAVDVLNDRVAHVGRLNTEIADWLAERRRVEESYASGLRKLARKPIRNVDLGIFSVPWSTLTDAIETQADTHASLASKIEIDVERLLREFANNSRELQAITTTQGNLRALSGEVDQARLKIERLQSRGERADSSRYTSAVQELESAQTQWESQAPYTFESLQALDETRFSHLRDVLTQLHTHEIDQVEKDRVSAEQCLNVLLNVEIADEIKTFVLKAVSVRQRNERPSRQGIGSPTAPSSRPTLAPTMSQTSGNEESSQRTPSVQEDEKKKGGLKGLKRFSTVMGRKKDRTSKFPSQLESMAEAPESKSRSFGGFGRKKKDAVNLDAPAESPNQRPYSPLRIGSEVFEPATLPAANGIESASEPPAAILSNGGHQNDMRDLEPPRPASAQVDSIPKRDDEGFSVPPPNDSDPITQAQLEAAAPQYNVNIRAAPIAEDQNIDSNAALADMASKLQMQAPPPQRRGGTVRGRRDNRNSAFIPAFEPAVEPGNTSPPMTFNPAASTTSFTSSFNPSASTSSAFSAFPAVSRAPDTTPALSASSGTAPALSASSGTAPALSATAATIPALFAPNVTTPALPASELSSALPVLSAPESTTFNPAARALVADPTGDNRSIRSGRSLASTASQGHKHPDFTTSGLNASILETVSARFENGKVISSSLVGEVALAYNSTDSSIPSTETIVLHNFASLEKVAPNPAFVSSATRDGEYTINLAGISKTQIAFKYQARLDEDGKHAPLLITTAFKIEPTQTSVIVSYAMNPTFFHTSTSITLTNVVLGLTLEGAKAAGCQSKPLGTFAREKNLIFWSLGDITIQRGAPPVKLLARFVTESEANTGSVEARWEMIGEQATLLGSGLAINTQSHAGATDGADPFADESAHHAQSKAVHTVKKLASGSYSAR